MPVVQDEISLVRVSNGDDGRGILGTPIATYAQSASGTNPPTTWSTIRPTVPPGEYLWTRVVTTYSDNTESETQIPTLMGRGNIVVNTIAPSSPTAGMLWQTPTDPNVQIWDGSNWIDWGIAAENILAENLVVNDGKFEKLIGTEIEGGIITNPFDYWDGESVPGGTDEMWRRGQTTMNKSEVVTMWEDYNKTTGIKVKEGGVVHDSNGVFVFVNDPTNYNQRASYTTSGIRLADSRGLGNLTSSFLTYSDLVTVNDMLVGAASGWSQYATTGENAPIVSRVGRQVTLTGSFKPNSPMTISADWIRASIQLPVWARPKRTFKNRTQGTGMNTLLVRVTSEGYIEISRYGKDDYVNLIGGEWITIDMSYAGADIF